MLIYLSEGADKEYFDLLPFPTKLFKQQAVSINIFLSNEKSPYVANFGAHKSDSYITWIEYSSCRAIVAKERTAITQPFWPNLICMSNI